MPHATSLSAKTKWQILDMWVQKRDFCSIYIYGFILSLQKLKGQFWHFAKKKLDNKSQI